MSDWKNSSCSINKELLHKKKVKTQYIKLCEYSCTDLQIQVRSILKKMEINGDTFSESLKIIQSLWGSWVFSGFSI